MVHENSSHPPVARSIVGGHQWSSASRVDLDFFDPSGVQELRHTLTRATSAGSSDITLAVGEKPFDFEKTLRWIIKRRDEADIKSRELGVMFRDLRVLGAATPVSYQPTLGSMLNPLHILDAIQAARHPPFRDILSGFEGVVRPGEMLLVLGRPGSGCSTLLKTLANQRSEFHSVKGEVHYDSISPEELAKHYRGDVQYCPEDDLHFPTLTVEETLKFAVTSRAPRVPLHRSRTEYIQLMTEILTTLFGLRHAKNTPVGDAAIRGVSGGEKKRVSIAEALATRGCIGAWDNSTRGLDASTALEFVRALRIATGTFRLTSIVSIYQAGEPLYQLFDKVCVIYEGKMAYFGPADRARQYFIDMGYEPANRQTTADFLVAVTDPNGRKTRPGVSTIPRTAVEFAEHFKASTFGEDNRNDMDSYRVEFVGVPKRASAYMESAQGERAKNARKGSPYTISIPMQARAVIIRRVQILKGNLVTAGMNTFSFVFQAVIMGTVFFRTPESTSAYFSRGGVLFFTLVFSTLTAMTEIPALYSQRPIVLRHQKAALYHPFIEALALTLVDVPITFVTAIMYSLILYFLVRLQQSASQFCVFFLFVFTVSITMKAWFRGIAAAFKSEATAQTFAGISLIAAANYTGFTVPKTSMTGALRWITYINPIRYGFEAILTNEFRTLNGSCASLVPQGPGYENISLANQACTVVGSLPGQGAVDGNRFLELSYDYAYANTWMNFGIVAAFGVAFIIALLMFTEYNTASANETSAILFRRGAKSPIIAAIRSVDEENDQLETNNMDTQVAPLDDKIETKPASSSAPTANTFSFRHLEYTVPIPGQEQDRRLLDDVSGYVAPGKLTALMGESGAGKTTLLNVLAQRTSTGVITGDRFINGHELPRDFQSQTGYCQQMDTHLPTATVREALLFSAKMRRPKSVPLAEKKAYVEECLKMCGLEAYGDASIGSLGIEHRKRTTIGVELAAKPRLLLFLDEPTSGLDSQSAWSIMKFLRSLANNGQAILCTIHQPSAELFQVFDKLLLLRKGGSTVYFGDIGCNASTLISYFEKNGSRSCAPDENPAEFMLDVVGAGATATSDQDWSDIWQRSKESMEVQRDIDEIHAKGGNQPGINTTLHSEFGTSWAYQTIQLIQRDAEAHWRDPTYLLAKLVLNVVGGLFVGFTFYNAKDTLQGTQDKLFAIYMTLVLCVPLSNQLQVPFINMRDIYEIRERSSRMYTWTSLVTSQILVEVPWNILGSSLLFLTLYWTVGFSADRAGYSYLMLGVVFPVYYTTIAQAVAAMSPNAETAAIAFSFLFSFVLTFNGVLQPFRQLGWWQWMYHLSPFTYMIEGLLGQAVGQQTIACSALELLRLEPPSGQTCGMYMQKYISFAGGYLNNPEASGGCEFCSVLTSDQFLESNFNIFYRFHKRDVGIMMAFIVFNIVMIYILTFLFRVRSRK